jgi:hypothetical protein
MSSSDTLLSQLLGLVCDLYEDTEGFVERKDDAQLWYNRGYANGMIAALTQLGFRSHVEGLIEPDPADLIAGQELLPWGKAYAHGLDMGQRETHEVMGSGE